MKFWWGVIAVTTVLFLFAGLYLIGIEKSTLAEGPELNNSVVNAEYTYAYGNRLSMKQIDSLTAAYNLSFTSVNAKITSLKSLQH